MRSPRCKICKSTNDVRSDGLCMGCYDAHVAALIGINYGHLVARYGHNYCRVEDQQRKRRLNVCAVCGAPMAGKRKGSKYCSVQCRRKAIYLKSRAKKKNCHGCRWYIAGSRRCVNPDSSMFGTDFDCGCPLHNYVGDADG